ncbi:hypothetical protein J5N97_008870 [Dioscorea zingiberensis]|uniref:Exonuclease domain-containing protein n=1 Tax=Dioscorea zingiberensis TaxID=325984 RepID=A0A9D5CVB2_9LILI|nr:hypothetical protein J5N97_008870 [Dioscorea zingiberensis]
MTSSTTNLVYPRRSFFRSFATKAPTTAVIVFDTETTGFSRHKDRIIEIAARDLQGHGRNSTTFETLINPEIPVKNSHVHGITTQMVCKPEIPRFKEMVPKFLKFVNDRRMDRKQVLLVAHNARKFDVPFLVKEFQRYSMEVPSNWLFLDTLPLAQKLVKQDGN